MSIQQALGWLAAQRDQDRRSGADAAQRISEAVEATGIRLDHDDVEFLAAKVNRLGPSERIERVRS